MRKNSKSIAIAVLTLIGALSLSFAHGEEPSRVYIKPDQLPGLPKHIAAELTRLGCLIPQGIINHANAIEGEFAAKGQKDWAVLCAINQQSHIHIFWGGAKKCASSIAEKRERDYLHKTEKGDWEYYRGLEKVGKEFITEHL